MITNSCSSCAQSNKGRQPNYRLAESMVHDSELLYCVKCHKIYQRSKLQKSMITALTTLTIFGVIALSLFCRKPFIIKYGLSVLLCSLLSTVIRVVILRYLPWQQVPEDREHPKTEHINRCENCQLSKKRWRFEFTKADWIFTTPSVIKCDTCNRVYIWKKAHTFFLLICSLIGLLCEVYITSCFAEHIYALIPCNLIFVFAYSRIRCHVLCWISWLSVDEVNMT